MAVVEHAAPLEPVDEALGGLFDQVLHLLVGRGTDGHKRRLAAVRVGHIDAVQHEHVEMRVEIERRSGPLHEGQNPRRRHEKATMRLSLQSGQRKRTNPWASTPHSR